MDLVVTKARRMAPLATPTRPGEAVARDIVEALIALLADFLSLYLKTKNFHWLMSGPHFRDYHRMLDEQAAQVLASTEPLPERVRKIGGTTLRSIGQIAARQRILNNDADFVALDDMLAEVRDDNQQFAAAMRETHGLCDAGGDLASASLLENWIDKAEQRTWFLFEAGRRHGANT